MGTIMKLTGLRTWPQNTVGIKMESVFHLCEEQEVPVLLFTLMKNGTASVMLPSISKQAWKQENNILETHDRWGCVAHDPSGSSYNCLSQFLQKLKKSANLIPEGDGQAKCPIKYHTFLFHCKELDCANNILRSEAAVKGSMEHILEAHLPM